MYAYNNNLYNNFLNDNPDFYRFNVGGLDFIWNNEWKTVGINLSGGADSAMLAYTIASHIKKNNLNCRIHAINYNRCWLTRPWQKDTGTRVFNYLQDMFKDIIVERHITYVPPEIEHSQIGHSIKLKSGEMLAGEAVISSSFNNYCAHHYNLDVVFNATTANPPDAGPNRVIERDLDLNKIAFKQLFSVRLPIKYFAYRPLLYVMKNWVYSQYIENNILELYNTTMSCEGDLTIHDNIKSQINKLEDYSSDMKIKPCGQCWWCWERKWAEDSINV